jgi:hypothetical protein
MVFNIISKQNVDEETERSLIELSYDATIFGEDSLRKSLILFQFPFERAQSELQILSWRCICRTNVSTKKGQRSYSSENVLGTSQLCITLSYILLFFKQEKSQHTFNDDFCRIDNTLSNSMF